MKGRDMKYFTDDDDDKRVRDYRKSRDTYDFNLEPRHVALLVVVGVILGVLLFSAGYITGKSQGLKGFEVAKGPAPETNVVPTPSTTENPPTDAGKPNVDFYDTLGGGGVKTEELGSSKVPQPATGTPKPPTGTPKPPTGTPKPPTEVVKAPTKPAEETKTALFFIQMITTKDKKKADDLVKSLKSDGYPAYSKVLPDGTTRVGIKWYKTKAEVEKVLKEITSKDKYKSYKPEIGSGWQ